MGALYCDGLTINFISIFSLVQQQKEVRNIEQGQEGVQKRIETSTQISFNFIKDHIVCLYGINPLFKEIYASMTDPQHI